MAKKRFAMLMAAISMFVMPLFADEWDDESTGYTWYYRLYDYDQNLGYSDEPFLEIIEVKKKIYYSGYSADDFIAIDVDGDLVIPNEINGIPVVKVGNCAFENNTGLTSVTFGWWSPVRSIGAEAFRKCTSLKSVSLPGGLCHIGSLAFNRCHEELFDTVTVPGVKLVDGWVVESDESLSGSLNLADTYGVADNAFNGRSGLTDVTLPEFMEVIGDYTFGGCSGLAHLTIPSGVKRIGNRAFSGCETLSGRLSLPSGLQFIGEWAFSDCKGLRGVTIPDSVINIASSAFSGCASMWSFVVGEGNEYYKSVSGLLLSKDGETLVAGINGAVAVPDGVAEIADYAFAGRTGLRSVAIPESTTYRIGMYAFCDCSSLTRVTIPENILSIQAYAFSRCTALREIHFKGNSPVMGEFVFNFTSWCYAYVKRGSTGWDVEIPGVWNDCFIVYEDGPAITVTVTYDANGGSVDAEPFSLESGSAVGSLPTPTRDGYTFIGWWTSADGSGTRISASTIVNETVTYYARWVQDGGSGTDGLLHRWSFNGDLTDSVGGQTATLGGSVTTDGKAYITEGGDSSSLSYISLGSGILPDGGNEATIEMWVTRTTSLGNEWSRIFEIGDVPDGFSFTSGLQYVGDVEQASQNSIGICWTMGGGWTYAKPWDGSAWSMVEMPGTEEGVEYHIAAVYKRTDSNWRVTYYCLDTFGTLIGRRECFVPDDEWSLAGVGRGMCVLGQALTTWDWHEGARYNEFRVWNRALSQAELLANDMTGPDVIAGTDGSGSESGEKLYCVIDLSAGSGASSYPVSYLDAPPAGGFNTDEYKTTKLVLRRITPGSFVMGGASHVTLSKPYYIGLFEVTQEQVTRVTGDAPPSTISADEWGAMRPMVGRIGDIAPYNQGACSPSVWPHSFLGRIRERTGIMFDLPTEAQWEYACRAGTTSDFNNGGSSERDLALLGRYAGNRNDDKGGCSGTHTKVGSYVPNAWGLYDMHGNVSEVCRDKYGELPPTLLDPVGDLSGLYATVFRGGNFNSEWETCSSLDRGDKMTADPMYRDIGFRVVLNPSDEESVLEANLDCTGFRMSSGGDAPWTGQAAVSHDGVDAMQIGTVSDGQTSWMQVLISGSAQVSFWWKTSAVYGGKLSFYIDGVEQDCIDGDQDWVQQTYFIPSVTSGSDDGGHVLKWVYEKEFSVDSDCAWVDQLVVKPMTLDECLDTTGTGISYDWDSNWFGQIDDSHDGEDVLRSAPIPHNFSSCFATTVSGPAVVSFWWNHKYSVPGDRLSFSIDGIEKGAYEGYHDNWYHENFFIPEGEHRLEWSYSKDADSSDDGGYALVDQLEIVDTTAIPLQESLDVETTGITVTSGGDTSWFGQQSVSHDGVDAARSGGVADSQTSRMQTTVAGPAEISFWWKVSSSVWGGDSLSFSIDGTEMDKIEGEQDWTQQTYSLPAGNHLLEWAYTKDFGGKGGLDCGWVDQLVVRPSGTTSYTVTYDPGAYGSGLQQTATKTQGVALWLPEVLFTREGYTQTGWSLRYDGSTKDYDFGAAYTENASITLYPYWTKDEDEEGIHTADVNGVAWSYVVVNGGAMVFGGKYLEWDDEEGRDTWKYTPAIPRDTFGAVTIPSWLGGYPVTAIGDGAFTECEWLTSVTIPYGVTSIGEDAFSDCVRLSSVAFPAGLLSIGKEAFESCALASLDLPQSLTEIGEKAFGDCANLRSVTIPAGVSSLGYRAFQRCYGLSEAYVPVHLLASLGANEVFRNTSAAVYGVGGGGTAQPVFLLQPWTAKAAVTLRGAVYDGAQDVAGIVELKVGKPNAKKRNVKVSGSVTLMDGKKRTFKALTVPCDGSTLRLERFTAKGLGAFSLEIGANGFTGGNGSYTVENAEVGGKWTREAGVYGGWTETGNLPAGTLAELLPDYEALKAAGGKWVFAKPAKVKYGKRKEGGIGLTLDTAGGKTNLSAMKLTYTPKTGVFKGSFKIYAVQGGKLKKFSVKVTGFVVDGTGFGLATLAKPKTTWWLQVD